MAEDCSRLIDYKSVNEVGLGLTCFSFV